jgi:hypothetical protein
MTCRYATGLGASQLFKFFSYKDNIVIWMLFNFFSYKDNIVIWLFAYPETSIWFIYPQEFSSVIECEDAAELRCS